MLSAPLIATTLQRDTLEVGGNAGLLSIGGLPGGVQDDHLTWVPVRGYGVADGGLPPSPDAPNEVSTMIINIIHSLSSGSYGSAGLPVGLGDSRR